jgi:hypothetical protein
MIECCVFGEASFMVAMNAATAGRYLAKGQHKNAISQLCGEHGRKQTHSSLTALSNGAVRYHETQVNYTKSRGQLVGMGKMVNIFRCPPGQPIREKRVYKQLKQVYPPDERRIRHVYRECEGYLIDPGILDYRF